jgi:hypothetical protein
LKSVEFTKSFFKTAGEIPLFLLVKWFPRVAQKSIEICKQALAAFQKRFVKTGGKPID